MAGCYANSVVFPKKFRFSDTQHVSLDVGASEEEALRKKKEKNNAGDYANTVIFLGKFRFLEYR